MSLTTIDSLQWLLLLTFIIGFFLIAFGPKKLDSVLTAFLTALICWVLVAGRQFHLHQAFAQEKFYIALGETANIVFFLIFALAIVELMKMYQGFERLTKKWKTYASKGNSLYFNELLWVVTLSGFFLAAVIDNVTAGLIIAVSVAKFVEKKSDLYFLAFFGGVIGTNAGGTFSPIGEVTTTQLWAGGQITFLRTAAELFIPSLLSVIVPLLLHTYLVPNRPVSILPELPNQQELRIAPNHTNWVMLSGIGLMMGLVPFLKGQLELPPSIGVLAAFSMLWLLTDALQRQVHQLNEALPPQQHYQAFSIKETFQRIEWETPLFFLGILLAVSALKAENVLQSLGASVDMALQGYAFKQQGMTFIIGLVSAVMDNVALVATVQGMYPIHLAGYELNSVFWFLLSFCAGTGGSLLVVGSAAGVAVRNKLLTLPQYEGENLDKWFRRRITIWAAVNYITGFLSYLAVHALFFK
jgi:Na+/H+ antiporter NhaD/arsenite permease-like protein